jgi:DNA modification methylase
VPVHVATDLTPDEVRAYRLADNKTAELASWDDAMLSIELDALRGAGIDWTLLGFDEEELAKLLAPAGTEGLTDPDAVPEKPADPITKPGDLWLLGKHRLLCGDSTSATDVARLLDGAVPALMVTDPPYGVEYDPEWRMDAGLTGNTARMGKVMNDDRADWTEAWKLFPGDVAYVYHAGVFASTVQQSLERAGFAIRAQIIWAKDRLALSRGDYHWQHEPCWYAVREGGKGHRTDDRTQTTLWSIPARDDAGHGHGTQKPVECMERPVRNHLADLVYEPFAGSGTTVIACERTGRTCMAMELDPGYCDVVVRRWEDFTGRKAERVQAEGGE